MVAPQVFPTGLGPFQLDNLDRIVAAHAGFLMLLVHQDADTGWPFWAGIVAGHEGAVMVAADNTTDAELLAAAFDSRDLAFDLAAIRAGAGPTLRASNIDQDTGFATDLATQLLTHEIARQAVCFSSRPELRPRMIATGREVTDPNGLETILRSLLTAAPTRRRRPRR